MRFLMTFSCRGQCGGEDVSVDFDTSYPGVTVRCPNCDHDHGELDISWKPTPEADEGGDVAEWE